MDLFKIQQFKMDIEALKKANIFMSNRLQELDGASYFAVKEKRNILAIEVTQLQNILFNLKYEKLN